MTTRIKIHTAMKALTETSEVRRETCADDGAGADVCAEMTQTGTPPRKSSLPLGPQPRLTRRWPLIFPVGGSGPRLQAGDIRG
jgi:hypothetical protein